MRRPMIVAIVATAILSFASAKSAYERKESCKERTCLYNYIVSGEMHNKRGKEEIEASAKVILHCESVGVYKDESVKYYCIRVKEAKMGLLEVNETIKHQQASSNLESKMKKKFCFARNENGKIISVFYPHDEETDIINFKKTITAAFQANFAKTEVEEESDSQSKHKSHYTYSKKGDKTTEHRSVSSKDVSKFSGDAGREAKIDFHSEEDIDVDEDKVIHRSHGESTTLLDKNVDPNEEDDEEEGEDTDIPPIEIKNTYTLRLQHCQATSNKRSIGYDDTRSVWEKEPIEDTLIATLSESLAEYDQVEMSELYDELPDLAETVRRAARSTDINRRNKIQDADIAKWRRILHLESQHGSLDGRKPKIHHLTKLLEEKLLEQSEEHKQLRMMLYSLLSSEGSLQAQEALLNALQQTVDVEEYDNIVISIALLESADASTVSSLKKYMQNNSDGTVDEQLLLAFATLGRHKNVEHEVVGTITEIMSSLGSLIDAFNSTSKLMFLIHALGNTGSKLMIPYISPFLLSHNSDIQLAAIDALRTVSTYESVQKLFGEVINNNASASAEAITLIVESLIFPYESFNYYPKMAKLSVRPLSQVTDKLIESIVNVSFNYEDSKLFSITEKYLKYYGTDKSVELLNRLKEMHHDKRTKRARTSYWNSRNTAYNVIASYSSRVSDTNQYPYHKAYLWTHQLGPSKVHARVTVGGFSGVGSTGYRVFGKGVIDLHAYGRTYRAIQVEYQNRFRANIGSRPFRSVKVGGSTLLHSLTNGYGHAWNKRLYSTRVFNVQHRIWVWIGYLSFYIEGRVHLDASLVLKLGTIKEPYASAEASFGPTFSITGGTSYTILIKFQVGLEIKASINYAVTPKASAALCDKNPKADASLCYGIMHGSNGIDVDLYAFFRKKICRVRRWRRTCWWGAKAKLSLFSATYSLGFLRQSLLWGRCQACSCSGALHNYCSTSRLIGNVPGARNCRCSPTSYA